MKRDVKTNHDKHKHTKLTWKCEKKKPRRERGEFHYNNDDYRWASL